LLGKALMNIRDKIRSDREVKVAQQAALAPQPIPRRKKPSVAIAEQQVDQPPSVLPGAVPRPIRRRPQVSIAAPVQSGLEAQPDISEDATAIEE
jgi:hypothetical protein